MEHRYGYVVSSERMIVSIYQPLCYMCLELRMDGVSSMDFFWEGKGDGGDSG